jgi:hypothetical protein
MATPFIMLFSIITAGGGHGTSTPTLLCYPIFFLFDIFKSGGGPLVWILLLGQFPLYGLIIDLGKRTPRQLVATGLITLFHVTLILVAATDGILEAVGLAYCAQQKVCAIAGCSVKL